MPAALSDRGQALLDELPAYYAEDSAVQGVCAAIAGELERLEDAADAIRSGMVPGASDDTHQLLSVWESLLALPVAQADLTTLERQVRVLAAFRQRRVAEGRDWVALMTTALGTELWQHIEVAPYSLTLVLPYSSGTAAAATAVDLARRITPANLALTVVYGQGFIVGYSQVGIDPL